MKSDRRPLTSRSWRARIGGLVVTAVVTGTVTLIAPPPAIAGPVAIDRPDEPVVLTGADLPTLEGVSADDVVAFRYAGGWQQVPVQVDERAVVDYGRNPAQNTGPPPSIDGTVYGTLPTGQTELQYTDADTFVGPDPDPMVDDNDEVVFMARDAGVDTAPAASDPTGVRAGTGVEVTIEDPLVAGAEGVLYLFESDGSLDPGAGMSYVNYDFSLDSGEYKTTYRRDAGPNPESSTVTTNSYRSGFSDRWILDVERIDAGAATGADILDRYRFQFAPNSCGRSTATFVAGEGAFIVNHSGPVRALRSYIGANSGPYTQRTHRFYEERHEIETDLRVHPIGGLMDIWDFSPAATGMIYSSSTTPGPVAVDGSPDSVSTTPPDWELVTGSQGSMTSALRIDTSFAEVADNLAWYYEDEADNPTVSQCTGDGQAIANSGPIVSTGVPCTDPEPGCGALRATRTIHHARPGRTSAAAAVWAQQLDTPLVVTTGDRPLPGPHLAVSVDGVTTTAGERLEATITVDNTGDEPLTGVEITRPAACATTVGALAVGAEATVACGRPTSIDEIEFPDKSAVANILGRATSNETGPVDLTVTTTVLPPDHSLSDVPLWVDDATDWIVFHQIATGYPDHTYRPDNPITRAQVTRMLHRLAGSPDTSTLPDHTLTDIPAWIDDAVTWITHDPDGPGPIQPIAAGYPDHTYRPDNPITRAQVTRMLHRLAGSPDTSTLPDHTLTDIPAWIDNAVTWITHDPDGPGPIQPIAAGYPDHTYRPDNPITRAQVTRMLCRLEASAQIDRT